MTLTVKMLGAITALPGTITSLGTIAPLPKGTTSALMNTFGRVTPSWFIQISQNVPDSRTPLEKMIDALADAVWRAHVASHGMGFTLSATVRATEASTAKAEAESLYNLLLTTAGVWKTIDNTKAIDQNIDFWGETIVKYGMPGLDKGVARAGYLEARERLKSFLSSIKAAATPLNVPAAAPPTPPVQPPPMLTTPPPTPTLPQLTVGPSTPPDAPIVVSPPVAASKFPVGTIARWHEGQKKWWLFFPKAATFGAGFGPAEEVLQPDAVEEGDELTPPAGTKTGPKISAPFYKKAWFWGVVGGVALGGGVLYARRRK